MNLSMSIAGLAPARSSWMTAAGVAGFAVLLAAASQAALPVPGSPVPITLQPLVVVLAGLWLGPRAGALSMAIYLAAGAMGLPVFSPIGVPGLARLIGPTGGYLIAYPAAAFVAGWLSQRGAGFASNARAAVAGILVLYVGGVAQLTIITGSVTRAALLGGLPFVTLDLVKAHIAAALAPRRGARTTD